MGEAVVAYAIARRRLRLLSPPEPPGGSADAGPGDRGVLHHGPPGLDRLPPSPIASSREACPGCVSEVGDVARADVRPFRSVAGGDADPGGRLVHPAGEAAVPDPAPGPREAGAGPISSWTGSGRGRIPNGRPSPCAARSTPCAGPWSRIGRPGPRGISAPNPRATRWSRRLRCGWTSGPLRTCWRQPGGPPPRRSAGSG
jgi:hypothetical protein